MRIKTLVLGNAHLPSLALTLVCIVSAVMHSNNTADLLMAEVSAPQEKNGRLGAICE